MNIALETENDMSLTFEGKVTEAGAETRNGHPENGSTPNKDETANEQPVGLLQASHQAFPGSPSVFVPMESAKPGTPVTQSPSCWDISDQQAESMLFPDTTNGVEDLEGQSLGNREDVPTSAPSSTWSTQPTSREADTTSRKASNVSIAQAASIAQAQRSSNTQDKRLRIGSPKWYFLSSSSSGSER
ncbi:hypothetical protein ASPVEDRAFT_70548 [Aspergillus versicolor CBS 583.65]|uniref:Uncharacterized protein n=1 Tax=Aspergillus versicolor CBS 583.65 TaxID=1036611 RepID=A0A1L9PFS5_ASPVE|nr:uncharacterized protein ASPVEDRAFT_70548 [Aspergillus versicolor CBS 583.65]OJJ00305.1 hypothetical protein ASPVEDRAFT_70548 [Aspergillus versicolor CBS 583.65]